MIDPVYAKALSKCRPLSKEEEHEVAVKAKAGDKAAREKLLLCNTGMALKIACAWYRTTGVSAEDLFHVAMIGSMKSYETFDPSRHVRFLTYAIMQMENAVKVHLQQCEVPVRSVRVKDIRGPALATHVRGYNVLPLDYRVNIRHVHNATIEDTLAAEGPSPEDQEQTRRLRWRVAARVASVRRSLRDVERAILDNYLMSDRENRSEIARRHNLSRERVRQLEKRLIERLRLELETVPELQVA